MINHKALHDLGNRLIELSKELNKLSDSGKIINEVIENEIEEQKKKAEDIINRIRLY